MSFAQKAADLCHQEWARFGNGTGRETDAPYRDYVREYWVSIGINNRDGATEEAMPNEPGKFWRPPWSAAFISWIARKAGAGDRFGYNAGHAHYVTRAWRETEAELAGRLYQVHRVEDYAPRLGDLVHFSRTEGITDFGTAKPYWASGKHYNSHCDLVVEIAADKSFIQTIGGNTGDSKGLSAHTVGRKRIALGPDGKLKPRQPGPWLAVLECLDR